MHDLSVRIENWEKLQIMKQFCLGESVAEQRLGRKFWEGMEVSYDVSVEGGAFVGKLVSIGCYFPTSINKSTVYNYRREGCG